MFAVCCRKKVIFCCARSWRRTRKRTVSSSSGTLWTTLLRVSHTPSTHAQNDALPLPAHRLELQLGVCECRDDPGPPPPTRPRDSHPRLWPSSNDQVRRTSQLEGAGLPAGDVLHVLRQVGGAGGGACLWAVGSRGEREEYEWGTGGVGSVWGQEGEGSVWGQEGRSMSGGQEEEYEWGTGGGGV